MFTKTVVFLAVAVAIIGTGQTAPWTAVEQQQQQQQHPRSDQTNPNLTHIICQPQMYVEARDDHTREGIKYLRDKPQDPQGPPSFGPHTNDGHCTRVSCEYASAIYVCNDNADRAVRVPLGTIADYTQAVLDDTTGAGCNFVDKNYEHSGDAEKVVWGQAFDANGWNVIVGMWHSDIKC